MEKANKIKINSDKIKAIKKIEEQANIFLNVNANLFEELIIFYKLYLTIAISSAGVERSFSTYKDIHTTKRNCLC